MFLFFWRKTRYICLKVAKIKKPGVFVFYINVVICILHVLCKIIKVLEKQILNRFFYWKQEINTEIIFNLALFNIFVVTIRKFPI